MLVRVVRDCLDRRQVFRSVGEIVEVDPAEMTKWMEPIAGGVVEAPPESSLAVILPVSDADRLELETLTKAELVHVAAMRYGLDLSRKLGKEDMIAAIEAARRMRGGAE